MQQKWLRVNLLNVIIAQRVWPTVRVLRMVHLNWRRCIHRSYTYKPLPRTSSTDRWCCSHECMTTFHFLLFSKGERARDGKKPNICNFSLFVIRQSTLLTFMLDLAALCHRLNVRQTDSGKALR